MDNVTALITMNALTLAGILGKIIFDLMRGDDKLNRQGIDALTKALYESKEQMARFHERLDALTKQMASFNGLNHQVTVLNGRLTRLEDKLEFIHDCTRDFEPTA
jgi:uncharacterized coiled-coil protein SlyX